jgi:hypothetical protein
MEWDVGDLAASNAIFWTENGWDGSDKMIDLSKAHCTILPDRTWVSLVSWSTVQTVIVTLQGAESLYALFNLRIYSFHMALDKIFYPLAVLSLLRLWSCVYITDEYSYTLVGGSVYSVEAVAEKPTTSLPSNSTVTSNRITKFHPTASWRSRIFSIFFVLPLIGLVFLSGFYELPIITPDIVTTTSSYLVGMFYLLLMTISSLTYSWYFLRGWTGTTIIPCISTTWYKIYSVLLMVYLVLLLVLSGMETRKTPCGIYTTWAASTGVDFALCPNLTIGGNLGFDLKFALPDYKDNNSQSPSSFVMVNYTGYCIGELVWAEAILAQNCSIIGLGD